MVRKMALVEGVGRVEPLRKAYLPTANQMDIAGKYLKMVVILRAYGKMVGEMGKARKSQPMVV